ncbi:TetR/AcrR family transcriptional regulator [Pseudomonas sp. B21-056]|jgi:AcrR family transcriptional regulator|uniref:TetR/AcrR family transcriptional regulator n=1 Tax=Pseudomonas sp. B21-056 TaxID=2895495 RepID=UPI00222F8384|nr:TetR/AcrR family transcriptional regulator [Pseudomonas sp. B21-056]UZE26369.1 TetR/AcrR family transcriptional regulator [Pseudomonas sp. B21-056]
MPRIVDHEERRRQICDVLLDVVAEVGIADATIRGVAARSAWSVGVIGHYFANRHDLLLGGLRRAAEILAEHNTRILSSLQGIQALEQILEGSIPLDGRRLALSRIFFFFYIEAMNDEVLRQEVESYLFGWRKSVARAIHQAQDIGDLPAELDPKQICADLVGLADGLSMHALLDSRVMLRLREQSPVRFWIRRLIDHSVASEVGKDNQTSKLAMAP